MMILGLVIQQEDTVAGVARRMNDQFASPRVGRGPPRTKICPAWPATASCGWSRKGRRTSRRSTAMRGRPRASSSCMGGCAPHGAAPGRPRRGAVQAGVRRGRGSRSRLSRSSAKKSRRTRSLTTSRTPRVRREQRSRLARGRPVDWRIRLRGIQNKDEARLWSLMSKRLERLREELEELLGEISTGSVDRWLRCCRSRGSGRGFRVMGAGPGCWRMSPSMSAGGRSWRSSADASGQDDAVEGRGRDGAPGSRGGVVGQPAAGAAARPRLGPAVGP